MCPHTVFDTQLLNFQSSCLAISFEHFFSILVKMLLYLYTLLSQLSKKYGPVFTVYFGPTKVVVLAGYETVREALVSRAEEFGDREISPIFYDINEGHGMCLSSV